MRTAIIVLALFVAAWLPRVLALDAFVTIDERKWLARSANFYQAISAGDLANTFQREHPGVTVMWAGTLGLLREFPDYSTQAPGQFGWAREELEPWLAENTAHRPLSLLAAARWWMTLGIALAVTACFWPLRRLLSQRIAIFTTLYLAWTPFFIALSRQLHLDGLVSALSLLSLLCFLTWLYADEVGRSPRIYLVASGITMGLAWLTKTPAILLVPTAFILLIIEWFRGRRQPAAPPAYRLIAAFFIWGLIATATFILLWPAMWVDPLGTLGRMAAEMGDYVEAHVNPNYFMGQPTSDPGIFFYPVAWFFRTTPLTVIGLIGSAIFAWKGRSPYDRSNARWVSMAMLIFTLVLTTVLTLTAKKFDRYLLPAFVLLEVIAALGWIGLADWGQAWWHRRNVQSVSAAATLILGVAVALHGLLGIAHFPYYLTYYNPLAGGSWTAPKVMFVGWGEGLDEAATWLNQQPDAEGQRAVAWYHDGPLSYFYDGQAAGIGYGSPMFWLDTDYAVVYVNQRQRQIPSPQAVAYFAAQDPAHTVHFRGLDLAHIYDMRDTLLPDFIDIGKGSAADFGERIRLAAYNLDNTVVQPGDEITATFYLQAIAPMETNYNVLVKLVGPDGSELWRGEGWPWGAPTAGWPQREIRPDGHVLALSYDAEPGLYKIVLSFYDPETLEPLPVTSVNGETLLHTSERDVAMIQVESSSQKAEDEAAQWQFAEQFGLSATLPETAETGQTLDLQLHWQSIQPTPTDYTVFVHVIGPDGAPVAQQDRPPLDGFAPTRTWQPGQQFEDEYAIPLPEDLPPGAYEVHVGLYTLEAGRLPVRELGEARGDHAVIGRFEVP